MGLDCAWTYATCDVETMISALFSSPEVFELTASKADQKRVWSRLDEESLGFCATDGGTLCVDLGFSLAGDEILLADLSRRVGRVLSMFLATHGGCAGFEVYEHGRRIRRVHYEDGKSTISGTPVPEEAKAKLKDLPTFYWAECDRLWAAFGLGKEAGVWSDHVSAVASGALRKVKAKKPAKKKPAKRT